jgi:DNA-binding SARP family transcriptional activator
MVRRVFLFGELRVGAEGEGDFPRVLVTRTRDSRRLMALLALAPTTLGRAQLGEVLWPEAGEALRRQRLRYALTMLRRALGEDPPLIEANDGLALLPGTFVDVRAFWDAVQEAVLTEDRAARLVPLKAALGLVRVPLLMGWAEPWVGAERLRLDACRRDLLRALVADLEALGQPEEAALWTHLTPANDLQTSAP